MKSNLSPGIKNLILLIAVAMMWSPSFLFIKVGLRGFEPVTFGMLRLLLAALVMYAILRIRGKKLPRDGKTIFQIGLMALTANAIPFILFPIGEMYAESGIAAIINSTTPVFTVIFAHIWLHDERLDIVNATGIFFGVFGVGLMFVPTLEGGWEFNVVALGVLAFLGASACYGISNIIAKRFLLSYDRQMVATTQFIISTAVLVPVAFLFESPFASTPDLASGSSLLALAIIGTVLPYLLYYRFIASAGATYVSFVTFIMPPIGIALGVVFLDEQLTWHAYAGCALILVSVMTVNNIRTIRRWLSTRKPGITGG